MLIPSILSTDNFNNISSDVDYICNSYDKNGIWPMDLEFR